MLTPIFALLVKIIRKQVLKERKKDYQQCKKRLKENQLEKALGNKLKKQEHTSNFFTTSLSTKT